MLVRLQNQGGQLRTAKIGFSWTVFFFGFFVPFCRGDAKWGAIMLAAFAVCASSFFVLPPLCGLANIVFSFIYNGIYIRGLLSQGFYPSDDVSRDALVKKGFIAG